MGHGQSRADDATNLLGQKVITSKLENGNDFVLLPFLLLLSSPLGQFARQEQLKSCTIEDSPNGLCVGTSTPLELWVSKVVPWDPLFFTQRPKTTHSPTNFLLFGTIIILVIIYLPHGLMEPISRLARRLRGRAQP